MTTTAVQGFTTEQVAAMSSTVAGTLSAAQITAMANNSGSGGGFDNALINGVQFDNV